MPRQRKVRYLSGLLHRLREGTAEELKYEEEYGTGEGNDIINNLRIPLREERLKQEETMEFKVEDYLTPGEQKERRAAYNTVDSFSRQVLELPTNDLPRALEQAQRLQNAMEQQQYTLPHLLSGRLGRVPDFESSVGRAPTGDTHYFHSLLFLLQETIVPLLTEAVAMINLTKEEKETDFFTRSPSNPHPTVLNLAELLNTQSTTLEPDTQYEWRNWRDAFMTQMNTHMENAFRAYNNTVLSNAYAQATGPSTTPPHPALTTAAGSNRVPYWSINSGTDFIEANYQKVEYGQQSREVIFIKKEEDEYKVRALHNLRHNSGTINAQQGFEGIAAQVNTLMPTRNRSGQEVLAIALDVNGVTQTQRYRNQQQIQDRQLQGLFNPEERKAMERPSFFPSHASANMTPQQYFQAEAKGAFVGGTGESYEEAKLRIAAGETESFAQYRARQEAEIAARHAPSGNLARRLVANAEQKREERRRAGEGDSLRPSERLIAETKQNPPRALNRIRAQASERRQAQEEEQTRLQAQYSNTTNPNVNPHANTVRRLAFEEGLPALEAVRPDQRRSSLPTVAFRERGGQGGRLPLGQPRRVSTPSSPLPQSPQAVVAIANYEHMQRMMFQGTAEDIEEIKLNPAFGNIVEEYKVLNPPEERQMQIPQVAIDYFEALSGARPPQPYGSLPLHDLSLTSPTMDVNESQYSPMRDNETPMSAESPNYNLERNGRYNMLNTLNRYLQDDVTDQKHPGPSNLLRSGIHALESAFVNGSNNHAMDILVHSMYDFYYPRIDLNDFSAHLAPRVSERQRQQWEDDLRLLIGPTPQARWDAISDWLSLANLELALQQQLPPEVDTRFQLALRLAQADLPELSRVLNIDEHLFSRFNSGEFEQIWEGVGLLMMALDFAPYYVLVKSFDPEGETDDVIQELVRQHVDLASSIGRGFTYENSAYGAFFQNQPAMTGTDLANRMRQYLGRDLPDSETLQHHMEGFLDDARHYSEVNRNNPNPYRDARIPREPMDFKELEQRYRILFEEYNQLGGDPFKIPTMERRRFLHEMNRFQQQFRENTSSLTREERYSGDFTIIDAFLQNYNNQYESWKSLGRDPGTLLREMQGIFEPLDQDDIEMKANEAIQQLQQIDAVVTQRIQQGGQAGGLQAGAAPEAGIAQPGEMRPGVNAPPNVGVTLPRIGAPPQNAHMAPAGVGGGGGGGVYQPGRAAIGDGPPLLVAAAGGAGGGGGPDDEDAPDEGGGEFPDMAGGDQPNVDPHAMADMRNPLLADRAVALPLDWVELSTPVGKRGTRNMHLPKPLTKKQKKAYGKGPDLKALRTREALAVAFPEIEQIRTLKHWFYQTPGQKPDVDWAVPATNNILRHL